MEDRFERQLKKGVLEIFGAGPGVPAPALWIRAACAAGGGAGRPVPAKERTLYPILYRLEDEGMIVSAWQTGEGAARQKGVYRYRKGPWRLGASAGYGPPLSGR